MNRLKYINESILTMNDSMAIEKRSQLRNLGSHPKNLATGQCKKTFAEFELKWNDNKIIVLKITLILLVLFKLLMLTKTYQHYLVDVT